MPNPTQPPGQLERALLDRRGKRIGREIQFRCPEGSTHRRGDLNPSARYHVEKQVWCCDVCGTSGGWVDLCRRLDIELPSAKHRSAGRPKVAARYLYRDEAGEAIRCKVRWEPGFQGRSKSFTWQKPDGKGGWEKSMGDGNPKLLYGTERLAAARDSEAPVLVVEGEKDCDTAWGLDWVAVCNPEGAAGEKQRSKWRASYSRQLRGLACVVVADKDTPGRAHAQAVASALHGEAASVAVIELPGEGVKDLADWVDEQRFEGRDDGAIREALLAETAAAAPWEAEISQANETDTEAPPSPRQPTQNELLLEITGDLELFHTPDREAYASVTVDRHRETWRVSSQDFGRWLTRELYLRFGQTARASAIREVLSLLEARALYDGDLRSVWLRVGSSTDGVVLDLGDDRWRSVEITSKGWQVVEDSPVHFRRSPSHRPLDLPVAGGSVAALREFLNVENDDDFVLVVAWLLAALRPTGPYPVLVLEGEQGSAKSTTARILRSLVDPSQSPVRSAPREEHDLLVSTQGSWVLCLDNLSKVAPWLSDALCRLSTGGGFSSRRLYTDREEVVIEAQRPVILNGIECLTHRQDLLDRALVVRHPPIPEQRRRTEAELWGAFEVERPKILGSLYSAVSAALRNGPSVQLVRRPRLADFTEWIVAAEPVLPWEAGTFLAAYASSRVEALDQSIESDPVATAVLDLLDNQGEIRTTPKDLLTHLSTLVPEATRWSAAWPRTARGLTAALKRCMPGLRQLGVEYRRCKTKDRARRRLVVLTRTSQVSGEELAV